MAASANEFAHYCCDLPSSVGPCVAKRMFGGYGISTEGLTLAILADLGEGETLWLKASDEPQATFEAAGCKRFVYLAKAKPMSMNYYTAPDEAIESPQLMAPWARLALEAALKAKLSKPAPKGPSKPKITKAASKIKSS
jgi:DNA transformation protein